MLKIFADRRQGRPIERDLPKNEVNVEAYSHV